MYDPRMEQLARNLIRYSCALKKGEKVLIEATDVPEEMVALLIREAVRVGGIPLVTVKHNRILRELYRTATQASMEIAGQVERARMEQVQAYVALRGSQNVSEHSDVPADRMKLYQAHWLKPVHLEVRVPKTKWVVLRWPSPSMAQQAKLSTDAFEDFYFSVCNLDYGRMAKAVVPLRDLMQKTDRVRLVGPGTDLSFSIKGMPAIACVGRRNIPDGEIFTAPVRESLQGTIRYNTRSLYLGTEFSDVTFTFKKGKIVKAGGQPAARLQEVLDTDEGARFVGEFALGINPYVTRAMLDTLFDEKIAGSIHLTPGNAYDEAFNGNRSQVHWDLVLIQTKEYGGGEIYFDGKLVRKDGRFVLKSLQGLNPDRLH